MPSVFGHVEKELFFEKNSSTTVLASLEGVVGSWKNLMTIKHFPRLAFGAGKSAETETRTVDQIPSPRWVANDAVNLLTTNLLRSGTRGESCWSFVEICGTFADAGNGTRSSVEEAPPPHPSRRPMTPLSSGIVVGSWTTLLVE